MKQIFFKKCLITLGFLFIFTLLSPITQAKALSHNDTKSEEYRLNVNSITLVKGRTFSLKVYNISEHAKLAFKSNDTEIASVSEDGVITANKVGDAIITVTVKDGSAPISSLECAVTVGLPAFSVKLTRSLIVIGLDKTDFLNVILKPSNTVESAKFSSNDSSIVSVSTGGRITAKKVGLTYVFAEIDALGADGRPKYSSCAVIVTSQSDAPLLEEYFTDHPELGSINEDDLTKALDEYFNSNYDPSSTSFISNLDQFLNEKFKLTEIRSNLQSK